MKHIGIVEQKSCTGCFACMNICPVNAISSVKGLTSADYPAVDTNKCISCGLCQSVCSVLTDSELREPLKCYAAYNDDDKIQESCASGGIATTLSKAVCESGGVVYGSAFSITEGSIQAEHICLKEVNELFRFSRSKYVQSKIGTTYINVKESLKDNAVLFIGTPCQVDGLQKFLYKAKASQDNLITIDLICHGVPPVSYLSDYLSSLNLKNVDDVQFKCQHAFTIEVLEKGKIVYKASAGTDLYYSAFLNSVIYRENCYDCKYAQRKRVSDITIGDFWKIDRSTLKKPTKKKISVVLINTSKGQAFWDKHKNLFVAEERMYEEAIAGNNQLRAPSPKSEDRIKFVAAMKDSTWLDALSSTEVYRNIEIEKSKRPSMLNCVKYKVKSILRLLKIYR